MMYTELRNMPLPELKQIADERDRIYDARKRETERAGT